MTKRRDRKSLVPTRGKRSRIRAETELLEIARGHDGFLRGAPEPVIVLGAFLVEDGAPRLLGRSVTRFRHPSQFPCTVTPRPGQATIDERVVVSGESRLALVCLAVEQDSSTGVQALFAALERAEDLAVFGIAADDPTPLHLDELDPREWETPRSVQMLCDGTDAAALCDGDEWVGAAVIAAPAGAPRSAPRRVHFVSPDKRNDWTARLRFRP